MANSSAELVENLFYEFQQAGVEVLIADMPTYNGRDRKDALIREIGGTGKLRDDQTAGTVPPSITYSLP